ncbi:hypothetical protein [Erythrobacter sp.]|uniref:hypothetical protein n=1 Tax=Erythrobacter sp. TaxID=1042 RepID=UPI0032661D86
MMADFMIIGRQSSPKPAMLLGAIAGFAFISSTAGMAQDEPGGPPPADAVPPSPAEQYSMSKGGVDMRTGQYVYNKTDLSIDALGGMSLSRSRGNTPSGGQSPWHPMGQFTHNWHIYATYIPIKGGEASFSVRGLRGAGFRAGNTQNFIARSQDYRSRLVGVPNGPEVLDRYFLYTASDGTKITFRPQNMTHRDRPNRGHGRTGIGFYASKVEEPNGVTYTLSYDEPTSTTPAFLRRVTSSTGYVLIFEWVNNAIDKYVSAACLFNSATENVPTTNSCSGASYKVSYAYGSNGHMSSAIDSGNNVWSYSSTYSPSAWDAAIDNWPNSNYTWTEGFYNPGEATPYLVNTQFRHPFYSYTSDQAFSDGTSYSYSWNVTEHNEMEMEVAGGVATDAAGNSITVKYQEMTRPGYSYGDSYVISQGPNEIIDELGRKLESDYCVTIVAGGQSGFGGQGNAVSPLVTGCAAVSARYWKRPNGRQSDYTHDVRGNILTVTDKAVPGSSDPDITRSFTYDCSYEVNCAKPTSVTDGNGNVSFSTYSTVHGGLISQVGPSVGGVAPAMKNYYVQREAWLKSGSGYAKTGEPIWLLSETRSCRTSALDLTNGTCSAGANDLVRTTYDYGPDTGPNNLWLRGMAVIAENGAGQIETLRTCYSYDGQGRRISETQPNADLASCQ